MARTRRTGPPRRARTRLAALICAACACIGVPAPAKPQAPAQRAIVEAAFTPQDDVAGLIVERIGQARRSVQVQAYLFTDRRIANALLAARKRGLAVEIVGDAAQHAAGGLPHLRALRRAGARVYLDSRFAAAHNKVMILDGDSAAAAVITGSYNFTHAAQARNAENVVVISGSRAVTARFVANFVRQREGSTPWR